MRLSYTEIIGLKELPNNSEASKLFAMTRLQSRKQEISQDDAELEEKQIGIQLQMKTNYFFLLDKSMEVEPVAKIMKIIPKRSIETVAPSRPKGKERRKADAIPTMVIGEILDEEVVKPKIVEIISPEIGQPTGIRETKPGSVGTKNMSGSLSEDRGNPDIKL